jgi:tRNA A37 threonylcarbamoyltransferase TsaD
MAGGVAVNALLNFIRAHRLKPSEVMNRLQDAAVISDNCVTVADVAEADQTKAVEWLKLNPVI